MPAFLVASDAGEEHKVADPGPPTMPKDGELMVIRHMQVSPRPPPAVAADDEANAGEQVQVGDSTAVVQDTVGEGMDAAATPKGSPRTMHEPVHVPSPPLPTVVGDTTTVQAPDTEDTDTAATAEQPDAVVTAAEPLSPSPQLCTSPPVPASPAAIAPQASSQPPPLVEHATAEHHTPGSTSPVSRASVPDTSAGVGLLTTGGGDDEWQVPGTSHRSALDEVHGSVVYVAGKGPARAVVPSVGDFMGMPASNTRVDARTLRGAGATHKQGLFMPMAVRAEKLGGHRRSFHTEMRARPRRQSPARPQSARASTRTGFGTMPASTQTNVKASAPSQVSPPRPATAGARRWSPGHSSSATGVGTVVFGTDEVIRFVLPCMLACWVRWRLGCLFTVLTRGARMQADANTTGADDTSRGRPSAAHQGHGRRNSPSRRRRRPGSAQGPCTGEGTAYVCLTPGTDAGDATQGRRQVGWPVQPGVRARTARATTVAWQPSPQDDGWCVAVWPSGAKTIATAPAAGPRAR